jgi:hypothetical protein
VLVWDSRDSVRPRIIDGRLNQAVGLVIQTLPQQGVWNSEAGGNLQLGAIERDEFAYE